MLFLIITVDSNSTTAKSGRIIQVGNSGTVDVGVGVSGEVVEVEVGVVVNVGVVGLGVDIEVAVGVGFKNGVVVTEPSGMLIVSMLLQPPA